MSGTQCHFREFGGWTPGKPRVRKIRYPIVKKTASKPHKEQQKSA